MIVVIDKQPIYKHILGLNQATSYQFKAVLATNAIPRSWKVNWSCPGASSKSA
jgi:hypothetical protein